MLVIFSRSSFRVLSGSVKPFNSICGQLTDCSTLIISTRGIISTTLMSCNKTIVKKKLFYSNLRNFTKKKKEKKHLFRSPYGK